MRRVVTKEHQCRETVNIFKNNLKIYVIIFRKLFLCGGWTDNIVLFDIQLINHHTYI